MNHPIVGVLGKKRAGKNTAAEALVRDFGFTPIAFADPLRELLVAVNPIVEAYDSDNSCGDPDCCGGPYPNIRERRLDEALDWYDSGNDGWEWAKDNVPETRRLMQALGDGVRNVLNPNAWIDEAVKRILAVDGPVVVTDVRYRNEADMLRLLGSTLVRIKRPGAVAHDPHPSETELDDYAADLTLENAGTVDDLHRKVAVFAGLRLGLAPV